LSLIRYVPNPIFATTLPSKYIAGIIAKWEMGNGKWEMGNGKWEMGL
jgi:hypothetical protein